MAKALEDNLSQVPLNDVLRAEEGVAEGAAILANEKSPPNLTEKEEFKYPAVGLKLAGDKMHHFVREWVSLPFEYSKNCTTHKDNMERLTFTLVQGESLVASENQSLGRVKIPVQPEPEGQQTVTMNMRIDVGG